MNNKNNKLHQRCLNVICNDKMLPFLDLLAKDGSVTIYTRNLRVLVTKMFNVHKNMSTELMQGLFCVRQTHFNLSNPHHFVVPSINSVYHGSESISSLGPSIWNLVPDRLKEIHNISSFKNEMKRWQP